MLFDDRFLDRIHDQPYAAAMEICTKVLDRLVDDPDEQEWRESEYDALREGYVLLDGMLQAGLIPQLAEPIEVVGDIGPDCREMAIYIRNVRDGISARANLQKVEVLQARVFQRLGTGFAYEFTQGDLDRIQALIAALRKQLTESDLFDEDHRRRLLKKLEKLQAEVHKRMSDLDQFWAMAGEAGVALGKFGKDAKPFVDRIRELLGIAWGAQARAEDLPSNSQLPGPARDLLEGPGDGIEP